MPGERPSRADLELVQRLQDAGTSDMTWTRLKRWRKAGLLPDPTQRRVPGERGSTSSYPEGTFEQVLVLDELMKRHRSIDKCAVLLFLRGYSVDVESLRRAMTNGLELIDKALTRDANGATDPDEIASRMAHSIVTERQRKQEGRSYKQRQLAAAGDERRLIALYTSLARPLIGASLSAGGLFAAYKMIGQDFRSALDVDSREFERVERSIDQNDRELVEAGGVLELLRRGIPDFELAQFVNLRAFCREATSWLLNLGFPIDTPNHFATDLIAALGTQMKDTNLKPTAQTV